MASMRDILESKNGAFSSSSSVHPSDRPSAPPSDPPPGSQGEGRTGGGRSEDGINPGWILPCANCGIVEQGHVCAVAWRWEIVVPDDPVDLAHYLLSVWGIRYAELIATEVGAEAIRGALSIVRRGGQEGRIYTEPAGLIVKLARRIARANNRRPRGK